MRAKKLDIERNSLELYSCADWLKMYFYGRGRQVSGEKYNYTFGCTYQL